jgi:LPS O-antigen subunit length determinant protein (WzzB/FepE family)
MSDIQSRQPDDEIDLSELVKTLWQGKWTIVACTCLCFVVGAAYHKFSANPFKATLEIKPITQVDAIKYSEFNALGFNPISTNYLLTSFTTKLQNRQLWLSVFDEVYNFKQNEFESLEKYNDWIRELTYAVKFELPTIDKDLIEIRQQDKREFFAIKYSGDDLDKVNQIIEKVTDVANGFVKSNLATTFNNQVLLKEQSDTFTKEDLQNAIDNLLSDYDKKIANRLAFLDEQGKIARKLGIAKSTFESQTFQSNASSVTNVNTDTPFYMRGFEAIEEEIALVSLRKKKEEHISELIDLEAQVRAIEQDKTVLRAQALFEFTPLKSSTASFVAAQVDINEADIKYSRKGSLILALSLVLGGFIGIFAVFVRKAIISK